jgi:cytochrome c oxidase subunit 4
MNHASTSTSPAAEDAHHGLAHVMPAGVLLNVFAALIVLTVVTVAASYMPFGSLETWVALGIATIKASLVGAYFMHLRYDNPLNAVLFIFGLLFVALFVGIILMDIEQYNPDLIPLS